MRNWRDRPRRFRVLRGGLAAEWISRIPFRQLSVEKNITVDAIPGLFRRFLFQRGVAGNELLQVLFRLALLRRSPWLIVRLF